MSSSLFNDDGYMDNLTVNVNKSPLLSASSATETDGGDTEHELAAMRMKLSNLVSDHHRSSLANLSQHSLQLNPNNAIYHHPNGMTHSVRSLSPTLTPKRPSMSYDQIQPPPQMMHPAVQKLYEQQQQLLSKLQLLEKDDPNPESSKVILLFLYTYTVYNQCNTISYGI